MQIAISVGSWDKTRFDPINNLSTSYRRGTIMIIEVFSISAGLAFFALRLRTYFKSNRTAKVLAEAGTLGVAMDDEQNSDAKTTYAAMSRHEEESGQGFTGKKARFKELMRVVADGPTTVEEIRFLFAEGIEPIVRPDGSVYVPCLENQHLSVDGELPLLEEDIDRCIEKGFLVPA